MKSIIANWQSVSDEYIANYKFLRPTPKENDDLFDIKYRNMIDYSAFSAGSNATINTLFPASNLALETCTKEMLFTGGVASDGNTKYIKQILNKEDSEGYNFIAIKINKLNKEMIRKLETGGEFIVSLTDVDPELPSEVSNLSYDVNFKFTKASLSDSYSSSASLEQYTTTIDLENCVIYITPDMLSYLNIRDRNGDPSSLLYHRYVRFCFTGVDDSIEQEFAISNITVTNCIEVEFENGVTPQYKSLDKIRSSRQGIDFIDVYNTRKELALTIDLLDYTEFSNLDKFFKKNRTYPFFILPFMEKDAMIIDNANIGGFLKLDSSYSPNRELHDLYSIKLKLIEVI